MAAGASTHWESMWAGGLRPGQAFDVAGPCRALVPLLSSLPAGETLVPGCGRAYDAVALAADGRRRVLALDLAPTACQAAEEYIAGLPADSRPASVTVASGDFFTTSALQPGHFDLVWDCTFLCALDPSVRKQWAARYAEILKPAGELVTLVFPIGKGPGGPPFALSVELIEDLLRPHGFQAAEDTGELPPEQSHMPSMAASRVVRWRRVSGA
eukprot:CAMPEP_0197900156 /NCGR_PEP_ID=MMETSP1439-20131203/48430_1 /TAXON_ID=66791 /ORGANISM="Gonyaulax spinifera, Strain CCMP409" /LENGTH=212 /DNA_ID=CAMNT_0043521021 /DNA_START=54 /DNA_END=692 /DNA_ORIENTATION=-